MAAMMKGDPSMVKIEFNDVTAFNLGTDVGEDDMFVREIHNSRLK